MSTKFESGGGELQGPQKLFAQRVREGNFQAWNEEGVRQISDIFSFETFLNIFYMLKIGGEPILWGALKSSSKVIIKTLRICHKDRRSWTHSLGF